jgi:hypothetical protein
MSAVDNPSETLREIVDAKINKNKWYRREIADCVIPIATARQTATEADRLMARNLALQEEEEENEA